MVRLVSPSIDQGYPAGTTGKITPTPISIYSQHHSHICVYTKAPGGPVMVVLVSGLSTPGLGAHWSWSSGGGPPMRPAGRRPASAWILSFVNSPTSHHFPPFKPKGLCTSEFDALCNFMFGTLKRHHTSAAGLCLSDHLTFGGLSHSSQPQPFPTQGSTPLPPFHPTHSTNPTFVLFGLFVLWLVKALPCPAFCPLCVSTQKHFHFLDAGSLLLLTHS